MTTTRQADSGHGPAGDRWRTLADGRGTWWPGERGDNDQLPPALTPPKEKK